MIAVSDSVPSKLAFSSANIEMIAVELCLTPKVLICCLYIPPTSSPVYLQNVLSTLESLSTEYDIIVTGDFNVPDINWHNLSAATYFSSSLCSVLFAKNLQQLILEPTHKQGNILDLVLASNPERLQHLMISNITSHLCKSDHFLIEFELISNCHPRRKACWKQEFRYAYGDYVNMDCYLLNQCLLSSCDNIELTWSCLKDKIFKACELFIPRAKYSTHKLPKWFNSGIRHLLNRIHTLKRKLKKSSNATRLANLCSLELKLQELMSNAKENYKSQLLTSFSHSPKVLYHHLRLLHKLSEIPQCLIYNSTFILDPTDKVEAFNNFFNSTFTLSDFELPPIDQMPTPTNQLSHITIDECDVFQALSNLSPSKAQGCDNISPFVLKFCATSLASPVQNLFTLCLSQCFLPQEWKTHKIRPIPKKGDRTSVSNYRPISLLCNLSKVLETIVYTKVISFIYPQLNKCQFGFLENRSCLSQLLSSFSHIYNAIDKKNACDVIYLDFKKAFDSVPHNELLFKLWRMGITGPLWSWFKAYLKGRSHFVNLDSVSSSELPVISGVPQGSVLGPLLFLIYINDLPLSISRGSLPFLFADDTKLVHSIVSFNDYSDLQEDILSLTNWCKTWNLNLNKFKCAAIRFSLSPASITLPNYAILDTPIKFSQCHQDLGIMVDEKLSWTKHYNHISLKAYRTLHLIRRSISPSAPVNIKKHLYIMLVRSQLTYCSQLWRPRLIKDIKCLERVQRRATKFVLQDYSSDYKTRLLSLKLLPLMYWFELQDILFLIRCFKDPSDNFFILNYVSFVNLNTRSTARKKLRINFNKTSLSQHFYFNRVARLWNSLPPLDLSLSFNTLKFHIKQLFWNHFTAHFNPNNLCSFHIVCPCPNCVNSNHSISL